MENEARNQYCPLCGTEIIVFENELTSVDCPKCGKYKYHISAHPFLRESDKIDPEISGKLSKMVTEKNKTGEQLMIDFELYQKLR